MNCGTCQFWTGDRTGGGARSPCLRFPPQAGGAVMMQGLQGPKPVIVWGTPETAATDGCGEWQTALVAS